MQTYDTIMLLILVSATIFGAIKGFAWQVASIASIVASYFVAYYFRNDVSKVINAQYPWNLFLAMLVLYGGSSFFIWMIFRLVSTTIDKVRLKEFDRHMGALFGFAKGMAFCLLITMFAMALLGVDKQRAICSSRSGYVLSKILANADGILPKEVDAIIGPHLDQLEHKLEQGRSGQLVTTPTSEQNNWGLGNLSLPSGGANPANSWGQAPSNGNSGINDLGNLASGILNSVTGNGGNTGSSNPSSTLSNPFSAPAGLNAPANLNPPAGSGNSIWPGAGGGTGFGGTQTGAGGGFPSTAPTTNPPTNPGFNSDFGIQRRERAR